MARYKNRPVEIEAEEFDGSIESAYRLIAKHPGRIGLDLKDDGETWTGSLVIVAEPDKDLVLLAEAGDQIVQGVEGQIYPVHPVVFAKAYEPV